MKDRYKMKTNPRSNPHSIVQGEHYRFTILTPQMIRLEYSEDNYFVDQATQFAICREFENVDFKVIERGETLEIITENLYLTYDKQKFSKNGLWIKVRDNLSEYGGTWYYGDQPNDLLGTARTLDFADGEVELSHGVISRYGFSVLDDSESFLLKENGFIEQRKQKGTDLYFFGYGHDYLYCLKDFYKLSGSTPLLPRYALGNWWSRFCQYREYEYKELMERFKEEAVPLSVAVIDMDWHLTDIDKKYGSGWTGYTWNKELFSDPEEFMTWLHDMGLKVTLNVHPAEGVRPHEEMYQEMAKELGIDYEKEERISFDPSDPNFLESYFKYLHHPNEKMGVDFWWIDWQQGAHSRVEGLDPLWVLNHYHYLDNQRHGKRSMILSRYAGEGSHRYPLGFSGDTVISWDTLNFQPYFTVTASNIGYCWWSHDIGGHMLGVCNEELATRWIEFGVFSPILRLHSSSSPFNSKEPWKYSIGTARTMKDYLRLRHKLIPYLYTMNYLCHQQGKPIIQPMYYNNPQEQEAYQVPNQYYFGSELIVHPITRPMNQEIGVGYVSTWLPEGDYIDFFTGLIYRGNRRINMYRGIDQIPVLAKAGAILPMADITEEWNNISNPTKMDIYIFAGDNGEFTLFEDDGTTMEYQTGKFVETVIELDYCHKHQLIIHGAKGDIGLIPKTRDYTIYFTGFANPKYVKVFSGEVELDVDVEYISSNNTIVVTCKDAVVCQELRFCFSEKMRLGTNDIVKRIFESLDQAQIDFLTKDQIYDCVCKTPEPEVISDLQALNLEKDLLGALCEIILAL